MIVTIGYGTNLYRAIDGRESFNDVMELCYMTRLSGDPRCGMTQYFYNGEPAYQPIVADLVGFLQEHRMYILQRPTVTVRLLDLPRKIVSGNDIRTLAYNVTADATTQVLFMAAPAVIEQQVSIPNAPEHITLETAAYLEPSNVSKDPAVPEDGALLRLTIEDANRVELMHQEVSFDPHVQKNPIPVDFDLSAYAGQDVYVVFETDPYQLPSYDWTMSLDPQLVTSVDAP